MKKTLVLLVAVGVLALTFSAVSNAYAQETIPPTSPFEGRGPRGGFAGAADGPLHDLMNAAIADALGVSVEELDAAHQAGQTAWDLAQVQGLTSDEFAALMADARNTALTQAVADGLITQEQANWMQSRWSGMQAEGFGPGSGNCDGNGPQGGHRPGSGRGFNGPVQGSNRP